jgi:hypothetical protein
MGRREIMVKEITQALDTGTGDEEVSVGRRTQGLFIRKIRD